MGPVDKTPPAGARLILTVFMPFGCGYYLSYLYRTVNAVISENLTTELDIGPADLGLLTSIYLITFAAAQIPLGVALDRYGPRRMNGYLLLVAAAGAALFAFADGFAWLLVGRGLIGLGVSAALMGSFKANALWFPSDRLPLMNNLIGACGAVGAISATRPVEMLLHVAGWRDIFAGLAVATVAVSLLVLMVVPEKRQERLAGETVARQFAGFREVIRTQVFWKLSFLYAFGYTGFVAYQTLWADPWLRDVAGLEQTARANYLLLIQIGFLLGLVGTGVLTDILRRSKVKPAHVLGTGVAVFIGLQVLLALGVTSALGAVWLLFGLMSASFYLAYAILTHVFVPELTGRAITAMNFLVFVVAFACQWGIGAVIEAFPRAASGGYSPAAHSTALWIMVAIQTACFLFFAIPTRGRNRDV